MFCTKPFRYCCYGFCWMDNRQFEVAIQLHSVLKTNRNRRNATWTAIKLLQHLNNENFVLCVVLEKSVSRRQPNNLCRKTKFFVINRIDWQFYLEYGTFTWNNSSGDPKIRLVFYACSTNYRLKSLTCTYKRPMKTSTLKFLINIINWREKSHKRTIYITEVKEKK